jgi:hypothetical protein
MTTKHPGKRTAGSCRFAPYYKCEWFDERLLAWRPVQTSFPTEQAARAHFALKTGKWRIMLCTEKGIAPL